jgi:hypothetical protein
MGGSKLPTKRRLKYERDETERAVRGRKTKKASIERRNGGENDAA